MSHMGRVRAEAPAGITPDEGMTPAQRRRFEMLQEYGLTRAQALRHAGGKATEKDTGKAVTPVTGVTAPALRQEAPPEGVNPEADQGDKGVSSVTDETRYGTGYEAPVTPSPAPPPACGQPCGGPCTGACPMGAMGEALARLLPPRSPPPPAPVARGPQPPVDQSPADPRKLGHPSSQRIQALADPVAENLTLPPNFRPPPPGPMLPSNLAVLEAEGLARAGLGAAEAEAARADCEAEFAEGKAGPQVAAEHGLPPELVAVWRYRWRHRAA